MSGEWDGLRAAAEAATAGPWVVCDGVSHEHDLEMTVCAEEHLPIAALADEWWRPGDPGEPECASDAAYIAAASPDVVLGLLDRLQAAEAAVDGLERRVADSGFDALDVFRSDRGSGEHERQGYLDGLRTAARIVRIALDGPQGDATGEVALGYADVLRVPERPPGWHEAETLCRGCAFCDSDHGGRRDGEGLA